MEYSLTEVKTYAGYNKEGEELCIHKSGDANTVINPVEYTRQIESLKSKISEFKNECSNKLNKLTEYTYTAIIIKDYNYDKVIDEINNQLKSIENSVIQSTNSYVENAFELHNQVQQTYNNNGYYETLDYYNVDYVKEV